MLVPSSISRSVLVLSSKGLKSLQSVTFIATFADGSQKFLNSKKWITTSLIRDCELGMDGEAILSKETCTLYHRDWSNNPIFGDFQMNYPQAKTAFNS
jgi:hypothetical protein